MKKILVLGGGGFIGGHLAKKLKDEGCWVRICDVKKHEYFQENEICHEFVQGDLKDINVVKNVLLSPDQKIITKFVDFENHIDEVIGDSFDEVYQLAADMGGAAYIFTGENDANVMHNSSLINLNVLNESVKYNIKKIFYSSSACMYPEHNQLDPNNPNCEESSAYPANPDSGKGGKEKSPAAMYRKVSECENNGSIEVWGDGQQTRSFLFIDECLEAVERLMNSDFMEPVNIGSEEMVTINQLAQMTIDLSQKNVKIDNLYGEEFLNKYGFKCPLGVKGRKSDNKLFREKIGWEPFKLLIDGLKETYNWVDHQVKNNTN